MGKYMTVKLTVVGSSPAWPNPGSAQSGYLIDGGDGCLLLDCGPGVLARLRTRNGWPRVDAIAITHFHLDHWGDLVPWTFGAMFGPGRDLPRVELWLPPGGTDELADFGRRLAFEEMFTRTFDVHEYADGEPFTAAGLEVTPIRLPHYSLQTYGLRVSDGRRTLAYSGDSAPSDRLADVGRDADLFLCEATLAESKEAGGERGHLSAEEALTAFRASGAHRLVIIHRPHELPLPEDVERAYDGDEYVL